MRTLRTRINADIEVEHTHRRVYLIVASAPFAAEQVQQAMRDVLAEHGVEADVQCDRWNPISNSWTSHEDLMNAERRKSQATGRAAWQVRVGPSSHRQLTALAGRLKAEGFSVARRWRHLFTGANCEDDTRALVDRIRDYSPVNTRMSIQRIYDRPPPVHQGGGEGGGWYQEDGKWHPA